MAPPLVRELFHRAGWVFEEKVHGWCILAYKDRDRVRLLSRHSVDHRKRFADVACAVAKLSPAGWCSTARWLSTTHAGA
jgi:hypothetical protein